MYLLRMRTELLEDIRGFILEEEGASLETRRPFGPSNHIRNSAAYCVQSLNARFTATLFCKPEVADVEIGAFRPPPPHLLDNKKQMGYGTQTCWALGQV